MISHIFTLFKVRYLKLRYSKKILFERKYLWYHVHAILTITINVCLIFFSRCVSHNTTSNHHTDIIADWRKKHVVCVNDFVRAESVLRRNAEKRRHPRKLKKDSSRIYVSTYSNDSPVNELWTTPRGTNLYDDLS